MNTRNVDKPEVVVSGGYWARRRLRVVRSGDTQALMRFRKKKHHNLFRLRAQAREWKESFQLQAAA